ncbi:FUSC family protein [Amycolatopsis rifamycinica]|uniref:FUSC family protein n=1 Tax=Amycolatopsis rifamycinica TaxID=287986 RepID=UPI001F3A3DEB|nr:FUSC family protein [Amycolatopsis rifamycinica]
MPAGPWYRRPQPVSASWFVAHDLLGHPQPFFAPIAAAVSLSASDVLRGQRAVQLMSGVALGIALGTVVEAVAGSGTSSRTRRRPGPATTPAGSRRSGSASTTGSPCSSRRAALRSRWR